MGLMRHMEEVVLILAVLPDLCLCSSSKRV